MVSPAPMTATIPLPMPGNRMGRALFIYGTLQFTAMMRAVLGRELALRPATLTGYARYAIRRRVFPAAIPRTGGAIHGYLAPEVTEATLERVDDYEGPPFHREPVKVHDDEAGRELSAIVYVLRQRYHCLLLDRAWDPDPFRRRWLNAYAEEFTRIYGTYGA